MIRGIVKHNIGKVIVPLAHAFIADGAITKRENTIFVHPDHFDRLVEKARIEDDAWVRGATFPMLEVCHPTF